MLKKNFISWFWIGLFLLISNVAFALPLRGSYANFTYTSPTSLFYFKVPPAKTPYFTADFEISKILFGIDAVQGKPPSNFTKWYGVDINAIPLTSTDKEIMGEIKHDLNKYVTTWKGIPHFYFKPIYQRALTINTANGKRTAYQFVAVSKPGFSYTAGKTIKYVWLCTYIKYKGAVVLMHLRFFVPVNMSDQQMIKYLDNSKDYQYFLKSFKGKSPYYE